jgi:hypothetical protein
VVILNEEEWLLALCGLLASVREYKMLLLAPLEDIFSSALFTSLIISQYELLD